MDIERRGEHYHAGNLGVPSWIACGQRQYWKARAADLGGVDVPSRLGARDEQLAERLDLVPKCNLASALAWSVRSDSLPRLSLLRHRHRSAARIVEAATALTACAARRPGCFSAGSALSIPFEDAFSAATTPCRIISPDKAAFSARLDACSCLARLLALAVCVCSPDDIPTLCHGPQARQQAAFESPDPTAGCL